MTDKYGTVAASDFSPPLWARNRHVQTIWPRFFQKRRDFSPQTERFFLPDGDFVDLAWGNKANAEKGIVVLFHGLEGSVKSHYANDLMAEIESKGFLPVLMHFRGCSGQPNSKTRAYHSGETEDAGHFLNWLDSEYPNTAKIAVGFSLGANMLLKFLGENPSQKLINAAIAVSPPLRLDECAKSIDQGFSRRYQSYLLKSMLGTLSAKMDKLDYSKALKISKADLGSIRSFRDFDEHITAPLHGYKGADDYYQRCSGIGFLKSISTPTLILHAADDPFMNENVIPQPQQMSSFVRMELSAKGGHVGFMQGSPWRPRIWLHQRVMRFVKGHMTNALNQQQIPQESLKESA